MRFSTFLLLAACGAAACTGGATAQELGVSKAVSGGTVDWNGFYAGLGAEFKDVTGPGGGKDQIVYGTLYAGANFTERGWLFGAEAFGSTYRDLGGFPSSIEIGAEGRVGLLVSEAMALYLSAGAAYDFQYAWSAIAGGGVEAMIAPGISIDVEYQHGWDLDAPYTSNQLLSSALFHF